MPCTAREFERAARAITWWLALPVLAAACGRAAPPPSGTPSESTAAADTTAPTPAGARAAPVALSRPIPAPQGPYAFRHEKHRSLNCDRCHTNIPGHGVHRDISCSSCHAPVPVTGPAPTPAECAACHHAPAQQRSCASCHSGAPKGPLTVSVDWKLSVWAAARPRQVTFDHGWHATLQCADCHVSQPQLVPTRDCGSCHQHHEGKADCGICHRPPRAGVHTNAAHAGCAGSGCHRDPPVKVATLSRAECLLCHADRVNHEPGKVCARCHMGQAPAARTADRPPGSR